MAGVEVPAFHDLRATGIDTRLFARGVRLPPPLTSLLVTSSDGTLWQALSALARPSPTTSKCAYSAATGGSVGGASGPSYLRLRCVSSMRWLAREVI
jgi:hypothetical protein